MDRKLRKVILCAALMMAPGIAAAQTAVSGTIAGVVKDASGAVLPGATVEALSPALIERVRSVTTDANGEYKIIDLRSGVYSVTFSLPGFSTIKREGLELSSGFTATVNVEMKVGEIAETITVSGATPVVDVQSTRTQQVMKRTDLDALPFGKTFAAFTTMIPGITGGSTSGGPTRDVGGTQGEAPIGQSVHGSDPGLTSIDGVKTINMATANWRRVQVNTIAAQEFVVETGNGSAEAWTGGVNINVVSKDGGNMYSGTGAADYTGKGLDSNNLNDTLRARGLTAYNQQKKLYDVGGGFGGPIVRDRLWFFTTPRKWANQYYIAGNYYNKTPHTLFYTPDLSQQAIFGRENWEVSGRVTWQASPTNKFVFQTNNSSLCFCPIGPDTGTTTPDGGWNFYFAPQNLLQANWTHIHTSKLLWEGGIAFRRDNNRSTPTDGGLPTDRSVLELSTGQRYGANFVNLTEAENGLKPSQQLVTRGALSYVTGSHAAKVGFSTMTAYQILNAVPTYPEQYVFRNQLPAAINEVLAPNRIETHMQLALGVYAQDQWTLQRMTLNLGVRLDAINAYSPAQVRPGGKYLGPTAFPEVDNIPSWKDINPRLGVAYDLFGNGKTAVKASVGRYNQGENYSLTFARNNSPLGTLSLTTQRVWHDDNGDFVPDCDLTNRASNGECGAIGNSAFGTQVPTTTYADNLKQGWGVSPYIWQGQISVQQELLPNVALTLGYYRTSYGNIYMLDNLKVTTSDFNSYCVTAPSDPRLPSGGAYPICGLYDVTPSLFGQVQNVNVLAPDRSQVYNGIDILINARFSQGRLLSGGLNTGRTVTDNCATPDAPTLYCRQVFPYSGQTNIKLVGVYPLPWWGLQASATYQNLPGISQSANYVFTNAQTAPSLGRNLAACPASGVCNATVTVGFVPPFTLFENRGNQLDVRLSKILHLGRTRLQGNFDVYNITNAGDILTEIGTYGTAAWLRPNTIMAGRLVKFSGQLTF
jgi:hypothetical protein